jgi:chondroitin AC lyase
MGDGASGLRVILWVGSRMAKTGLPVTTGVNQTFLNGEATIKMNGQLSSVKGKQNLGSPSWILHDQTGYLFPDGGNLVLQAENVEGSWNWVAKQYQDERIRADLFRLWFDHGINPQGGSYEYVLIPGADRDKLDNLEKDFPFEIRNNKNIQAVLSKDKSTLGIVFYEAGKVDLGFGLKVIRLCMVMLKKRPVKQLPLI